MEAIEKILKEREKEKLLMTEPTKKDLESPLFNAIWGVIKHWDVDTTVHHMPDGTKAEGYHGATGADVMSIVEAIKNIEK